MKILILTSVYKDKSLGNSDTSTDIVNSFVKEWIEQGHEVVVIHNSHIYMRFVHEIPTTIKKKLAAKMGFQIADYDAVCKKTYEDNGAKIYRLPIKKYIPHQSPSAVAIDHQVQKIVNILKEGNFVPDIITGHWASPQMEIISQLKKTYDCKTAVVLHGIGYINNTKFNVQQYLPFIDKLGGRSITQVKQIKKILNLKEEPFVCYSGVPDEYIKHYQLNLSKFENIKKWKFAYVGRLVAYKKVDATIKALAQIKDVEWEFNIVGDGAERENLETLAKSLNVDDRVHFLGRIPREKVMKILSETHCFIMISINEIFGLVYLEAMAASCITVASVRGGVDGVIVDGENGYLCEEGNTDNLVKVVDHIVRLGFTNIRIVESAYKTAHGFTDSKVAEKYISNIIEEN